MGALKVMEKYQADKLRDRLVRHIEADWPKSPLEWIALHKMRQAYAESNKYLRELDSKTPLEEMFPEPVSAICLARECDIPSILPAAFLALVGIEQTHDWENIREDYKSLPFDLRSARWSLLSEDDLDRLEHGKAELLAQCLVVRATVFDVPADMCEGTVLDCQAELKFRLGRGWSDHRNRVRTWRHPEENPNPMLILQEIDEDAQDFDLCEPCHECMRSNIAKAMKECWAELPKAFNLSDVKTIS
jgi:hypothetical protein